ncbi:MAG: PilN domain-containing protein [Gammaproteobacteria bacterium]|nr:PilN domain-containing protein [Gammaproteobacteria bacterium]
MAKINLLPWREELRKEKQKEFGILIGVFALIAGMAVGTAHLWNVQLIDRQQARNKFLQGRIVELDKKIKEIEALQREKERLIARMRAIEQLQRNRPLVVRFFDELVASLPEGVNIIQVEQKGNKITINGEAQSNARVSSFMRNLENSKWLEKPQLDIIQTRDASGVRISGFTLRFDQVIPKAEGEEDV